LWSGHPAHVVDRIEDYITMEAEKVKGRKVNLDNYPTFDVKVRDSTCPHNHIDEKSSCIRYHSSLMVQTVGIMPSTSQRLSWKILKNTATLFG
jgi:hypothetical protein